MSSRAQLLAGLVLVALLVMAVLGWDQAQLWTGWGLPSRTAHPMLIVAHRGNMADYPQDTAEAIWDAARLGADGIEFDVHQSADGTWWVMHDASVDATTNGTGLIRELSDAELGRLRIDAGPGFDRARHGAIALPRLDAVLEGLAGYEGQLYVDVQHALDADMADLVGQLRVQRATIICRTPEDVRLINEADASIGTLIRVDRAPEDPDVDALLLEAVSEATIGGVATQAKPVVVFTHDLYAYLGQEAVLRRAWAAGVDAFLAKRLADALEQREALEAARP